MVKYYIYHIPTFKWKDGSIGKIGCTKEPNKRIVYAQGYTDYQILEEHTDIMVASEREIQLQKEYGYKVDREPYWRTIKRPTKEGSVKGGKKGGKIAGKNNVESGHWAKVQSLGGKIQGKIQGKKNVENKFWENLTFEQRSRGGKTSGNNRVKDGTLLKACKIGGKISAKKRNKRKIEKYKSILTFIDKDEFTYSDMRNACELFGITSNSIFGTAKAILKEKTLVEQIHKGCNQYNPSLYKKRE
jgi:hypothetical protein